MDDQLRLDRHITEFFAEAKTFSLTPEEREEGRFAVESFLMAHSVSLTLPQRLQERMEHGRRTSGSPDLFLNEQEKRQLRKNLIAYMQQNPRFVPNADVQSFSLYRFFELAFPRFALGLLLFMGVGAGVTFASQSTAPGDFLYPFKVSFYEPIVSRLATSDSSQASWEARRAQNRLKEAMKLAAESKLTKEAALDLHAQFEMHVTKTQENIDELDARGNTEVAASIRTSLEKYLDSNSFIIREMAAAFGETGNPDVSAVSAAESPSISSAPPASPGAKDRVRGLSLTEKVKTIFSAPVAIPAASDASASLSVILPSSASSLREKKDDSTQSSKQAETSSKFSSRGTEAKSSADGRVSSSGKSVTDIDVNADIKADVQPSSIPSILVPALFDSIMSATSSTNPPLPKLLP